MRAFCYISYGFQDTPFQARKTEDGEDKSVHKRHLQLMKKRVQEFSSQQTGTTKLPSIRLFIFLIVLFIYTHAD